MLSGRNIFGFFRRGVGISFIVALSICGFTQACTRNDSPPEKPKPEKKETQPVPQEKAAAYKCEGEGRWIRFQNAGFPITFEYPENWRLTPSENSVAIKCPDSALSDVDPNGVEIDVVDDVDSRTEYGSFKKYQGTWLVSRFGGECDPADCDKADVSTQEGITVLHGSGPVRLFGPNGYLGIGDEETYLFLLPDRWVPVSFVGVSAAVESRIIQSVRPQH